ncbi:hypothetical protein [uncultured Polaribacter sp.]|uniref:hypothetical protein n=1 Tax=uncultured Polaribacter sp. TaxID=174711 RepID=UPI0026354151|nr:hypothetical protein [uncultured Polaribacter sp.]
MNKHLKISLIIFLIIFVLGFISIWKFLGKPYYKISLLGTEFIENASELTYVNEKLFLVKKYKYSKDVLLLGFGGGNSSTIDYYSYGVADKDKNILIDPKYQFISSKVNSKKEPIIYGLPHIEKGNEIEIFYRFKNNSVELISKKDSW